MKRRSCILSVLLAASLCAGCYNDIDLEKYRQEGTVVVNCICNTDTTVMASVSRTWFFTDSKPAAVLKDLNLSLSVNGKWQDTMRYDDDKYVSAVRPSAGDTLVLKFAMDGQEISATDVVPSKTRIADIALTYRQVVGNSSSSSISNGHIVTTDKDDEFTYRIRFKDEAGRPNYYFIRIEATDRRQNIGTLDYSYDPVFQVMAQRVDGGLTDAKIEGQFGLPFSDEGIDGKDYTLVIKETATALFYQDATCPRRIRLYSVSEAYYKYLLSLRANNSDASWQGGLANIGLAEPTPIFSNIIGGIGIMGCLQQDCRDIDLRAVKR